MNSVIRVTFSLRIYAKQSLYSISKRRSSLLSIFPGSLFTHDFKTNGKIQVSAHGASYGRDANQVLKLILLFL